jgi:glycosyltransferase involved in cell wall biosynthesis
MNWIHRRRRTGMRHYLRSEYGNLLLAYIRRFIADHVIYQSEFTRGWWLRVYGETGRTDEIILNGVDLSAYTPDGPHQRPEDRVRVQVVEGHLKDGHDLALDFAAFFAEALQGELGKPVELCVAGDVPEAVQARARGAHPALWLTFQGVVPRAQIPELDRSAHLLYSAEINPPCPNSVIEALACGLPAAGFATGSLTELIQGDAGRLAPYGGDPWRLERPDFQALARAAAEIAAGGERFRRAARERAEQAFDLGVMTERYLRALAG